MKGIILAAGSGTRLNPATLPISKILLPIFDRPMIYYPLSVLMDSSIKDVLIITNEKDADNFKRTLGDGSQFGIKISYEIQYVQRGIADAFIIAEDWIGDDDVALILGDNILYGPSLNRSIQKALESDMPAVIFGYHVTDPKRFGVVEFDSQMNVLSIEEKPIKPKSNYAAIGLYFYKKGVCSKAKTLNESKRGELEITDLNNLFLDENKLSVIILEKDIKWLDAGTFDSIIESSVFVSETEKKQQMKIMCPEIIAYHKKYVTKEKIMEWVQKNNTSDYYKAITEYLSIK